MINKTKEEVFKIFDNLVKSDLINCYYIPMGEEKVYNEIHAISMFLRNTIINAIFNEEEVNEKI